MSTSDGSGRTLQQEDPQQQGSWIPLLVVIFLLLMRWIYYGEGSRPVRIRRWYNLQRLKLRKQLGYRDDSVYKSGGAGQGASKKVKRQG